MSRDQGILNRVQSLPDGLDNSPLLLGNEEAELAPCRPRWCVFCHLTPELSWPARCDSAGPRPRSDLGLSELLGSGSLQVKQHCHGLLRLVSGHEQMIMMDAGNDIAADA